MNHQFQFRAYAEALYAALVEDGFYRTMEASVENQLKAREAMLKYLDYSMVEAEKYGELFIPTEHDFGVSVWSKPMPDQLSSQCSAEKKNFLLNELGEPSLTTYQSIVDFMAKNAQALIDPDAWYLSILGVLPEYQGQGLGPSLVTPVLRQTDQLGVSTYLETFTPRNHTFYQRLGYHVVKIIFEPTVQAEYAIMRRRAIGL